MSSNIPVLKPKKVIQILLNLGFAFYRQSGSHRIYVKGELQVVVPYHSKDFKKGTLLQIIKGTGLSLVEFKKLI